MVAATVPLLLVAATLLAVPAQAYLDQRGVLADAEADLAEVRRGNAELSDRAEHLGQPEEIERLARRDYGLVRPGEESYSILPPATSGLVLPRGWPFDRLVAPLERVAAGGG